MSVVERERLSAEEAVDALRGEVLRLRADYGVDLGEPYIRWRNRLRELMGFGPAYELAFERLLAIYEGAAE